MTLSVTVAKVSRSQLSLWHLADTAQRAFKQGVMPYNGANGAIAESYGRLVAYRGKREIPCPEQTAKPDALLTMGQSSASNSHGQRVMGHDHVVNYFDGKCYRASSPLLGTDGIYGDSWTLLGNKLVDAGVDDQVILIPSAISGTSIVDWQDGTVRNQMLQSVLAGVASMSLVGTIRKAGVDAPIYVSVASKCELKDVSWTANPMADARRALPIQKRIFSRGGHRRRDGPT